MGHYKKQRGMAASKMILLLLGIALIANLTIKLLPHYMDDLYIGQSLDELPKNTSLRDSSLRKIKESIDKRFSVNNINGLSDLVQIDKDRDQVTVNLQYERREPIMGNIDIVLKFNHEKQYPL